MKASRKKSLRGQTTIEYILLLALVVGVVTAANVILGPRVETSIQSLVDVTTKDAWAGGKASANPKPYSYYYVDSKMESH
ncbi:MAG: class III signal peptide-containing protein [Bdellovibrionota bacterium]